MIAEKRQEVSKGFLIRLVFCACIVGITLYSYVRKQNKMTSLRIQVPALKKELKNVQEENTRLLFEIEKFESPLNLMELSRKPEYSHLKYPLITDIIHIKVPKNKEVTNTESH